MALNATNAAHDYELFVVLISRQQIDQVRLERLDSFQTNGADC